MRIQRKLLIFALIFGAALLPWARCAADNGPAPGHGPYLVFAHYMPCFNAYGFSPSDSYWFSRPFSPQPGTKGGFTSRPIVYPVGGKDEQLDAVISDIRLAKSYGIDGFLVDELHDTPGYHAEWERLLEAADTVGGFYIGLMPDYGTMNDTSHKADSREQIKSWVDAGSHHPSFLRYDGKPVVFPYGVGYPTGYYKDLNESTSVGEKKDLVDWMAQQGEPIAYAPTIGVEYPTYRYPYANDPNVGFQTYAFAAGTFSPSRPLSQFDAALAYWLKSLMLMGENSFLYYNRGYRYSTNNEDLTQDYRSHWAWNIAHRDRMRWVMLVTWNDWGETAIAPSVNHFMAWQPITRYYADWFKTGKEPAIPEDTIEIFHRPHPYGATPTVDPYDIAKVAHYQVTAPNDVVEALAFLTAPATLVIHSGSAYYRQAVGSGVQSLVRPFALGVQSASIERDGKTVARVVSPVPITASPARQNLWYIGADSAHPPRTIPTSNWIDIGGAWTAAGDNRSGSGLSISGDPMQLGDSSVTASLATCPTANGASAGVVVHATDDGTRFYSLTIGSPGGNATWQLAKTIKGTQTVLSSGPLAGDPNGAHTLRLDCVGEYRIGYIDGALATQVSDYPAQSDYQLAFGRSGVTATGAPAAFSQIALRSYDPDLVALNAQK